MNHAPDTSKELYRCLSVIEDVLCDGYATPREELVFLAPKYNEAPQAKPCQDADTLSCDSIPAIAQEIALCTACRLASGRQHVVAGQGAENAPLVMAIGEGPGEEEDKTGLPFVGPAGRLLDKMLAAIGLYRNSNCYIANIVKCRPPLNRDPAPDEQNACMRFLERQIAVTQPKVFLALGRIPAQVLLQSKDGIGKLRGSVYQYKGRPLIATYHPSALLRSEDLKRPAWEDLKLLKSLIDAVGQ